MKISPRSRSLTNSSSTLSTCRRTDTSSAEVGSSAMITWGSVITIMAIMIRWPMPPETSWGYRS
ncbi:hypothetical protein D3C76_1512720 [compost metagenome]